MENLAGWLTEFDAEGCLGVGFGGGNQRGRGIPDHCQRLVAETRLAITFTSRGHHLDSAVCSRLKGAVHFIRISMDGVGRPTSVRRAFGRRTSGHPRQGGWRRRLIPPPASAEHDHLV